MRVSASRDRLCVNNTILTFEKIKFVAARRLAAKRYG